MSRMISHLPFLPNAEFRSGKFLLALLLLVLGEAQGWAQPLPPPASDNTSTTTTTTALTEQQMTRQQSLERDREVIERARQDLQARLANLPEPFDALRPDRIDQAMVEQSQMDVESTRLRRETALSELDNGKRRIESLQKEISELEARKQLLQNPAKDTTETVSDRAAQLEQVSQALVQKRADLELENFNLTNLGDQLEIINLQLKLIEQWSERIERIFQQNHEQNRQDAQAKLVDHLQADLITQQDRANELRQRLSESQGTLPLELWQRMATELRAVEEHINLLSLDSYLAETADTLSRLKSLPADTSVSSDQLQAALQQITVIRGDLHRNEVLLQQKNKVYEQQRQVIEQRKVTTPDSRRLRGEELELINQLLVDLNHRADLIQAQLLVVNESSAQLEQDYGKRLRQDLFTRKPYP